MDESDLARYGLVKRTGMAGLFDELVSGASALISASQQRKAAEASAKAATAAAKSQAAVAAAQQSIAASKAEQAASLAQITAGQQASPGLKSTVTKYLPWIAGGAVVIGAVLLMTGRKKNVAS
jgi:Flp pilus assembly protein TadB